MRIGILTAAATVFTAALLIAAPGGARAADLGGYQGSYKDTPAPYAAPGRTIWEGFHIGAHLGYSESDFGISQSAPASPLVSFGGDSDGIAGGALYGTSWQFGRWVLGTDSDITFSDNDSGPNVTANGLTGSAEIEWSTSSRARAGILVNPHLLVYGTAGIASASIDTSGSLISPTADNEQAFGFVYGGGIETTFNSRFFARVEYLHTDYDDKDFLEVGNGQFNVEPDTDVVRGAIGYRLDWSPLDLLR